MRILLIGPRGHGGEDVYVNSLRLNPPSTVEYELAGDFHKGAPDARCNAVGEVMLNRLVYPFSIPDIGFRAVRVGSSFDLVHVHAHPTRISNLGTRPLVMSEGSSPVVYVQEYLGWDDDRLADALKRSRRLYRRFGINDRLLTLERVSRSYVFSRWARDLQIRWGADPDKVEVLYPGFAPPQDQEGGQEEHALIEDDGRFEFLFVGRDFERKGGFDVVEAFDALLEQFPDARLTIAGSDPAERNPDRLIHSWVGGRRRDRVLARLGALSEAGRVQVRPWLDRSLLLNEVYPRADAFVMPPHAEGFGFTNVEAMSFGLPVITSTVGPAAEIVDPGRTGLLVSPGDVDGLTAAMVSLMGNRAAAREMGDAGRTRFMERFTLERFRANLGRFYERALGV